MEPYVPWRVSALLTIALAASLSQRGSHILRCPPGDESRYVLTRSPALMQRDQLMNTSEKFLRFAAECKFMAKLTRNPESKTVWSHMAERWLRCAELCDRQSSAAHYGSSTKRHRKTTPSWAH